MIILACRLVGKLAQRIGQPQVVGEMIAGVMLGPSLFGAVLPDAQVALFPKYNLDMLYVGGRMGVGIYMFLVRTEFQAVHIRTRCRSAMAVSWAGIAVPFVLAFALKPWLPHVPGLFANHARFLEIALFLGAAIAITAFPMLARIIHECGLAGIPLGRLALTAGARTPPPPSASWRSCWRASAAAGTRLGSRSASASLHGLHAAGRAGAGGRPVAHIGVRLGDGGVLPLGVDDGRDRHPCDLGGFILGVCLPRGALTERLQGMVVVVVLSLFFTYSGLKTQPSVLLDPAILLQAVAILLASFDGKAIACWAATRLSGESPRDAEAIGAPINARGLMELIIINIGLQAGIIEPGLFTIVVVMAILTALMATPLFNLIMRRTAVS